MNLIPHRHWQRLTCKESIAATCFIQEEWCGVANHSNQCYTLRWWKPRNPVTTESSLWTVLSCFCSQANSQSTLLLGQGDHEGAHSQTWIPEYLKGPPPDRWPAIYKTPVSVRWAMYLGLSRHSICSPFMVCFFTHEDMPTVTVYWQRPQNSTLPAPNHSTGSFLLVPRPVEPKDSG